MNYTELQLTGLASARLILRPIITHFLTIFQAEFIQFKIERKGKWGVVGGVEAMKCEI